MTIPGALVTMCRVTVYLAPLVSGQSQWSSEPGTVHTHTHIMGGKAYMMVHCTISILVSTYGVPTHSGDGRNLENFQSQTHSELGKVCTLERRSKNGDNCFYEPECAPKCVDIGVKVRNS